MRGLRGIAGPETLRGGGDSPESVGVYTADWNWAPCSHTHADCARMFEAVSHESSYFGAAVQCCTFEQPCANFDCNHGCGYDSHSLRRRRQRARGLVLSKPHMPSRCCRWGIRAKCAHLRSPLAWIRPRCSPSAAQASVRAAAVKAAAWGQSLGWGPLAMERCAACVHGIRIHLLSRSNSCSNTRAVLVTGEDTSYKYGGDVLSAPPPGQPSDADLLPLIAGYEGQGAVQTVPTATNSVSLPAPSAAPQPQAQQLQLQLQQLQQQQQQAAALSAGAVAQTQLTAATGSTSQPRDLVATAPSSGTAGSVLNEQLLADSAADSAAVAGADQGERSAKGAPAQSLGASVTAGLFVAAAAAVCLAGLVAYAAVFAKHRQPAGPHVPARSRPAAAPTLAQQSVALQAAPAPARLDSASASGAAASLSASGSRLASGNGTVTHRMAAAVAAAGVPQQSGSRLGR